MINLVLVTSVIRTSSNPLSYISSRSIYSFTERFEQTKKTIQTIREKIPNHKILIVECSELTSDENIYFKENSDYFINLITYPQIKDYVNSKSKSLGEGSMTICALEYIIKNNITYENLIKISGRYWLSSKFNYEYFNNHNIIIKYIDNNESNVFTALYKLPKQYVSQLYEFLKNNIVNMFNCIGYEVLFAQFIKNVILEKDINDINNEKELIKHISPIGLQGNVSVSNDFYDG
jgi:hypothetical protein